MDVIILFIYLFLLQSYHRAVFLYYYYYYYLTDGRVPFVGRHCVEESDDTGRKYVQRPGQRAGAVLGTSVLHE